MEHKYRVLMTLIVETDDREPPSEGAAKRMLSSALRKAELGARVVDFDYVEPDAPKGRPLGHA